MRRTITEHLGVVEDFLGYYPIKIESQILNKIGQLEFGILVVNLIFNMIKVMLIIISVLIIYSLLM